MTDRWREGLITNVLCIFWQELSLLSTFLFGFSCTTISLIHFCLVTPGVFWYVQKVITSVHSGAQVLVYSFSPSFWESAHSSFHQLLCNHKKFQPVCRCVQIRKQFSGFPTTGGHVFASAEQIAQIPGDLGVHLLYNSRTPVFPSQENIFQKTEQQFIRWSK